MLRQRGRPGLVCVCPLSSHLPVPSPHHIITVFSLPLSLNSSPLPPLPPSLPPFSSSPSLPHLLSLLFHPSLPLEGMKRKIMRNLRTLEQEGMVNSKNDYQEIINAIARVSVCGVCVCGVCGVCVCVCACACVCVPNVLLSPQQDIRNQHRYRQQRKQELTRLQETLDKLSKKASFYEEQMDYFQRYVKACLDSLAKAGRYV